ncbi:MAG TPA: hypothetical protein VFQ72_02670 [Candidatus Paceibacterota bacterium]|nr:hypothetical protein [Candidatus Paceibacterota bacterium]
MKRIFLFVASGAFLLFLAAPTSASAAWTGIETFDSYSASTSVSGLTGGSGWSGGWTVNSGSGTVDTAPSGGQGGLALHISNSASISRMRSSTGSSGILRFKVRIGTNSGGGVYVTDSGGGGANNNRIAINFNTTLGVISAGDGQTYANDIAPFDFNTWYDIAIKYGQVAGQFSISIDGGKTYLDNFSMGSGNKTLMDGIILSSGGANLWFDDINDDSGATALPESISLSGTIGTLARFSTSSTIGSSLFSDNGAGYLSIGTTTATNIVIGNAGSLTTILGNVIFNNVNFTTLNASSTTATTYKTDSNCNSSASPASCGSAAAGSVAIAAGSMTLIVNTSAVTSSSQILVTEDSSLGARLGITCNTTFGRVYSISSRTSGTSFTVKSNGDIAANPACLSYWIVN